MRTRSREGKVHYGKERRGPLFCSPYHVDVSRFKMSPRQEEVTCARCIWALKRDPKAAEELLRGSS